MATYRAMSLNRSFVKCKQIFLPLAAQNRTVTALGKHRQDLAPQISVSRLFSQKSQSNEEQPEYLADYEVSFDEFKYVEQILPPTTVPQVPSHESYPTPSGWFPPNEAIQSKKYLVRRTKNHMLPVYSRTWRVWYGNYNQVNIRKIEGDIWALESELRHYLIQKTGQKDIRTQVHEVSRQIRVRGLHTPLIAEFLLERGM